MNKILLIALLHFTGYLAIAQSAGPEVINSAGGHNVIAGNTYEYAIGHMIEGNTYSSSDLVVTPWVLQPNVEDPTTTQEVKISIDQLNVFPNPVEQTLFIQPNFGKAGKLTLQLTDIQGRNMIMQNVELSIGNERQQIDMHHLAAGQYHLNVLWNQNGLQKATSFKIQKVK